jgi:hypothetical protein
MTDSGVHVLAEKSARYKRSIDKEDSDLTESGEDEGPSTPKKPRINPEELGSSVDVILQAISQIKDLEEELEIERVTKETCMGDLKLALEREDRYKVELERARSSENRLRAQVVRLRAVTTEMYRGLTKMTKGFDTMGETSVRLMDILDKAQSIAVADSMERSPLSE